MRVGGHHHVLPCNIHHALHNVQSLFGNINKSIVHHVLDYMYNVHAVCVWMVSSIAISTQYDNMFTCMKLMIVLTYVHELIASYCKTT